MDRAIKFQNPIQELNINILDEYLKIFTLYNEGIFISTISDCKTRKYTLEERKNKAFIRAFSAKAFNSISSSCPFNLYIVDTYYQALAVLRVEKIYQNKEQIPIELFNKLIPEQIRDFCIHAAYKFSEISVLPYEVGNSIINSNTGKSVFDAKQINPTSPWYVEQLQGVLAEYLITNTPKLNNNAKFGYHPNYCVYRFYLKSPNGEISYIGMTNDIEERYKHHSNKSSWSSKNEQHKFLYLAFKNVGFEKFNFEILHDNLTEEQAHYFEAKEINNFNAYYPYGFNVRNEDKYLN